MNIKKVVFPVAGLGSRFLPATKAIPKEMLPIIDKPLIQYAVEEAIDAGFDELIFITGDTKRAITEHFDFKPDLNISNLTQDKKNFLSEMHRIIPDHISCKYIVQKEPLGLGHAILQAKEAVGGDPFAVVLADDLIDAKQGALKQMLDHYKDEDSSIVSVQKIQKSESVNYGIIECNKGSEGLVKITNIVEKPTPENAPSNFGVVGRYIFCNKIFSLLEKISVGVGNEIQLTDAIKLLLETNPIFGYEFNGTRYDCGTKLGFIKANISYAFKNTEYAKELSGFIKNLS
ncbi:MAG: UTP--glucose-1-phosphate uridylyltransferase GalU [Nitrosomonadales bacterium]|jgi:UTP--glucose-1-phosphate uridylyltransferase|nr:UTP--glucose-1-phosphate uridylyltransferase GalU [Nitrosomonadales bacterium]MBT5573630.1 UTP--glucose-1-phosphate uridylyltransferase GalU [Nitrosomonadales bacterium]MBT6015084.1 UTP--glucose-1-phosphate uridylyltransferase GalU [Nitrosomonadales bacterium]